MVDLFDDPSMYEWLREAADHIKLTLVQQEILEEFQEKAKKDGNVS